MEKPGKSPPTEVGVAPGLASAVSVTVVALLRLKRKARTRCESPKSSSSPSAQPKLPLTVWFEIVIEPPAGPKLPRSRLV